MVMPRTSSSPLGDHLDGAIDDRDGRLVVDRVCGDADLGGPPLRVGQGVREKDLEVREDRVNLA